MGLADLRITSRRMHKSSTLIYCDLQLTRCAFIDSRTRETVISRLCDGLELMRLPSPAIAFWYGKANFSPDGAYLRVRYAVDGELGVTEVWDLLRREVVFRQETRSDAFAFHPNGRHFFYAPRGVGLAVWDIKERRMQRRLPLDSPEPNTLLLDPVAPRLLVNSSSERDVRLLDTETVRELARWTGPVGRNAMAQSRDARLLASGDWNGSVFVWDTKKQSVASSLVGHTQYISRCLFAPASYLLATSSWDETLRLWDASQGRMLVAMNQAQILGFSPDGRSLALLLGERELALGELAQPDSYQVLNPEMIGNRTYEDTKHDMVRSATFSPDGRFLAIALQEGVHLYQGKSGTYLGHLQTGPCDEVLFDHMGKNLISGGAWGFYRWPIRRLEDTTSETDTCAGDAVQVGPPELLMPISSAREMNKAAWLPDKKTLAVIDNSNAQVRLIDVSQPEPATKPFDSLFSANNHRMTTIAVSPDGKWAACGGWKQQGISVWDLPSRRLVRFLAPCDQPAGCSFFVSFTPDGKRLISSSLSSVADYYSWEVGTWERTPLLAERGFAAERAPVFSPDGKIMCLWASQVHVRLVEAATGRTLANLANQLSLSSTPITFSPDGSRLVAGTRTKIALLWNLKRVRERLQSLSLDWDGPPYSDDNEPSAAHVLLQVIGRVIEPKAKHEAVLTEAAARLRANPDDVDALMMRGAVLVSQRQDDEAIQVLLRRRSLTKGRDGPDQMLAYVLNRRAHSLLDAGPRSGSTQDPVDLARKAVELAPQARDYVNTLGIALCRAERDAESIRYLNESLELGYGQTDAQDLYFLAIAHHRLGHADEAQKLFARAMSWQSRRGLIVRSVSDELDRFRTEARKILALPPSKPRGKDPGPDSFR